MLIFRVKSVKIYTGQKKFTRVYPWLPRQIWGMDFCDFAHPSTQTYNGWEAIFFFVNRVVLQWLRFSPVFALFRPLTIRWIVFWVSEIQISMLTCIRPVLLDSSCNNNHIRWSSRDVISSKLVSWMERFWGRRFTTHGGMKRRRLTGSFFFF